MKNIFLFILLFIKISTVQGQGEEVVVLDDPNEILSVGSSMYVLDDEDAELTIEDILSAEYQARFRKNDHNVFYRQPSNKAFWIKLTIENHTGKESCIDMGSSNFFYLDYYQVKNGAYTQVMHSGGLLPESSKIYPVNIFWLPIENHPRRQTVYVRFTGQFIISFLPRVGTFESLTYSKMKNDYMLGAFMGVMVVMFFYNLILLIFTRDKIYGWYIGFLAATLINTTFLSNYPLITYFSDALKPFIYYNYIAWGHINFVIASIFAIQFLDIHHRYRFFTWYIAVLNILLGIILPLINLSDIVSQEKLVIFFQLTILTLSLSFIIFGLFLWIFKGERKARFFTLGWFWAIGGGILVLMVVNGVIPYNSITRNSMFIGFCLESILFSLALADRINSMRSEVKAKEEENIRLVKAQNRDLESKVKERTEELQVMNEELQQSNEALNLSNEKILKTSKDLEESNKSKNRLFAIIGHDLRSPINSLKGLMQIIVDMNLSPEEFKSYVSKLKNSVENIHFTLNNLLFWAQTQMDGILANPQKINLYEIAKENSQLFEVPLGKKKIELLNELSESMEAFADPDQINLVFRNLINNAIKFTRADGLIKIWAVTNENQHTICIEDNGIGISPENLAGLFTGEINYNQTGTDLEKGAGLGLILCRDFIELNGGKIWVESELHKGSRFYFSVPKIKPGK